MDDEKRTSDLSAKLMLAYEALLAVDKEAYLSYCPVCRKATSFSRRKHNAGCIVERAILAVGKK